MYWSCSRPGNRDYGQRPSNWLNNKNNNIAMSWPFVLQNRESWIVCTKCNNYKNKSNVVAGTNGYHFKVLGVVTTTTLKNIIVYGPLESSHCNLF
jgi:hypothetical protein